MPNTQQPIDYSKLRDEKCEPIAQEVFELMAKYKPDFHLTAHSDLTNYYAPIQKQIIQLMLDRGVTMSEVGYIMKIVLSYFDNVNNLVVQSLQHSFDLAQQKLFKSSARDVSLVKIHEVLTDKRYEQYQDDTPDFEAGYRPSLLSRILSWFKK